MRRNSRLHFDRPTLIVMGTDSPRMHPYMLLAAMGLDMILSRLNSVLS